VVPPAHAQQVCLVDCPHPRSPSAGNDSLYGSGYMRWVAASSSIAQGRRCRSLPPSSLLSAPSASCDDHGCPRNCCCFRCCSGFSCPPRCCFCCCGCHFPSKPKLPPPLLSLVRPPPTLPPQTRTVDAAGSWPMHPWRRCTSLLSPSCRPRHCCRCLCFHLRCRFCNHCPPLRP
jgi:hypothetical protein